MLHTLATDPLFDSAPPLSARAYTSSVAAATEVSGIQPEATRAWYFPHGGGGPRASAVNPPPARAREKGPSPGAMWPPTWSSTWFWSMGATCGSKAGVADGGVPEGHYKKSVSPAERNWRSRGQNPMNSYHWTLEMVWRMTYGCRTHPFHPSASVSGQHGRCDLRFRSGSGLWRSTSCGLWGQHVATCVCPIAVSRYYAVTCLI
jgi:hypothetical protein